MPKLRLRRDMTIEQIAQNIKAGISQQMRRPATEEAINALTHAERRAVRKLIGEDTAAPRNLFFDYETQTWI